jgi:ferredoxin
MSQRHPITHTFEESSMKTDLFFYTGTGNSFWTARMLAKELGDAGQVAATLLQLKKRMQTRGLSLSSGFELAMPSNYIPWGGPGPEEGQIRRIEAARKKIGSIAAAVAAGEGRPVEKGPLWQNILFTWFNRLSFPHVPTMDRSFWVDEKCNACGICKAVCPSGNIEWREEGRPVWLHNCEQCLACIQWCPQEAIQFGKKTPRYKRYHHPEVTLQEMIAVATMPAKNGRRE